MKCQFLKNNCKMTRKLTFIFAIELLQGVNLQNLNAILSLNKESHSKF